jgi:DNA-binding MarR family transcriptional regulator
MIVKESNSKRPSHNNIESLAKIIEANQSLHFVMFADILVRYVEITLKKNDLSRLQGVALHNLVRKGGSLTPTELAKAMCRSKHSMTKIIDTLEDKGLVTRNGSEHDRRSTPIQITLDGVRCVKQDIKEGDVWIKKAADVLSDAEKEIFVNMADRLYKSVTDIINGMESDVKMD